MKNRLNNKGFAVTTVVYAILLLLIILMFTILVLYRNTYRNQKQFSADVQDELNEYLVDQTPPDTNPPTCTLTSTKNVDGTYTLTISSSSVDIDLEEGYSFDGINYSNEKIKNISKEDCASGSCKYKGYTKDATGNVTKDTCEAVATFDITPPTCTLTYDGTSLVISSTDTDLADKPYSFDGTNYDSSKTKPISTTGSYTGYVKDTSENVGRCYATLSKFTATFDYSNHIAKIAEMPGADKDNGYKFSRECFTTDTKCEITTPSYTVKSGYTAKGWSTSKYATSTSIKMNSTMTLMENLNNVTYYPVVSSSSSSGGSSSGGSCGCQPGIEDFGECIDGKRKVIRCDTTSQPCAWDSDGNPTKYSGGKKTYYENC